MEDNEEDLDEIKQDKDTRISEVKKSLYVSGSNLDDDNLKFQRLMSRVKTLVERDLPSSYKFDLMYRQNKEKELMQSIAKKENITKENIEIAENIDFKAVPDSIVKTDEYGFILEENSSDESDNKNKKNNSEKKEIKKIGNPKGKMG